MLPPYIVTAAGFNQLHKRYNGTTYTGDLGLAVHSVVSPLRSWCWVVIWIWIWSLGVDSPTLTFWNFQNRSNGESRTHQNLWSNWAMKNAFFIMMYTTYSNWVPRQSPKWSRAAQHCQEFTKNAIRNYTEFKACSHSWSVTLPLKYSKNGDSTFKLGHLKSPNSVTKSRYKC